MPTQRQGNSRRKPTRQDSQDSSQAQPRRGRVPLGEPLTVEELIKAVGLGDKPEDVDEAEQWWEDHAPTYGQKWLKAKKTNAKPPQ